MTIIEFLPSKKFKAAWTVIEMAGVEPAFADPEALDYAEGHFSGATGEIRVYDDEGKEIVEVLQIDGRGFIQEPKRPANEIALQRKGTWQSQFTASTTTLTNLSEQRLRSRELWAWPFRLFGQTARHALVVMKTIIIIVSFFVVAMTAFAQQPTTATTDDGRKISLYPDGTWRLLRATPSEPSATPASAKPKDANLFVKARKGPFGIWINQQKWKEDAPVEEDPIKITFDHKKGDAYAMIITERISLPTEALKKVALATAKGVAPDARILSEEKLVVSGKEVLCLKMGGTIQNIAFIYYGYYYGGSEGTLQVVTYTSANLFDEFKPDFDELLKGTQIGQ